MAQNKASASGSELWLHAWHDPLSNIKTTTSNMRMADLNGDGDAKLCICDTDKKIKVYHGTQLASEYALLDTPVGLCVTYTDSSSHIPSLAVAAGSHVFVYRQLRPYRKWSCPTVDIPQQEADIWNDLRNGVIDATAAVRRLADSRDLGTYLSSRSAELLTLTSEEKRAAFVAQSLKEGTYEQHTLITCMETIKSESDDNAAACHLVIGTESQEIIILPPDPVSASFLQRLRLPSVPVLMSTSGQFLTDWRVTIACRDGKMYSVKSGEARGSCILSGAVVDLGSQAVAMTKQDTAVWVATMDRFVGCYTARGKLTRRITMPDAVTELQVVAVKKSKVSHLLMVALCTGEIRMYREASLVHSFHLAPPITGMRFGLYGREENTLVVVHGRGALSIKVRL